MPGFDGTGPRGMGPMTGGGRGFCAMPLPGSWPRYVTPWGMPYYAAGMPATPFAPQMSKEQELDFLKGQTEALKGQLEQIDVRTQELEGEIKS